MSILNSEIETSLLTLLGLMAYVAVGAWYILGILLLLVYVAILFIFIFSKNTFWRVVAWIPSILVGIMSTHILRAHWDGLEAAICAFLLVPALVGIFTEHRLSRKRMRTNK
ncbi:hypothetical protein [Hymenobacter convexus]|uniref:hypothetical protein n=1 Tax=Hymenobacter sp. CA1UV-4 TaxID=3063782 RepID=UPI00272A7AF4|nr:hypothetical protein [Hymenobacter sp. CA1UV-4]